MHRPKHELLVLTLVDAKHHAPFLALAKEWTRYFYIKHIFDRPENIANYLDQQVGILFLDANHYPQFHNEYYGIWQKNFPSFMYVAVAQEVSDHDVTFYKALADQILHLDMPFETIKWKSIAILRRYWNTFSRSTTLIYKELIIDFGERKAFVNNREISLGNQEFNMLRILVDNKGEFVDKIEAGQKMWGYYDHSTRLVDQVVFKLKRKLGRHFFETRRPNGVKFE